MNQIRAAALLPEQVRSRMEELYTDWAHSLRLEPNMLHLDTIIHKNLSEGSVLLSTETGAPHFSSLQTAADRLGSQSSLWWNTGLQSASCFTSSVPAQRLGPTNLMGSEHKQESHQ